ncbi:MAG: hypothetical protein PHD67_08035 [Oscillospiraceae bacterium]|nr:hypothetical protein [Oscillospiraceae bacterium]
MKKRLARIALVCMAMLYCLPLTAMAAGRGAPPEEPYEKVAAKSGSWYSERLTFDGKSNLVIGYTGDYEALAEDSALEFSLSEKIVLTGVYVPYEGADVGRVELTIEDSRGNVYQGFFAEQTLTGGIGEADKSGNFKAGQRNTLYAFTPEYEIALPKGGYILYLDGDALPVDACLVKGYNHAAYERYEKELMEWAWEEDEEEPDELYIAFGNEELPELYRQFIEDAEDGSEYEPAWVGRPRELLAPVFSLAGEAVVDEMILSTWSGGRGAHPGVISILDGTGAEVVSYKAQGASQGGAPNTMWVAAPGITLPAGDYFLDMDAPEALDYDESGEPVFYVGLSAPAAPPASFTGTYKIWLDLYKTHTLMGPVNEKKSSFSLEDYELSVLDKGAVIELMGQYEGMPFSQNCEVTEREEDFVVAQFHFAADLTKLPYQANIAAVAEVTLKKEPNGRITIGMTGEGFYSRAATKERGADENTYELTLRGGRVKKDLPPFVMAALAKTYGAGNIPGPDTPVEAAVGMLFPPLVGLVVSAIQGLLRPKLERPLSVGEQAMKDANRSLGKGLYTEEEARAWATMADALGNSGGDPEDAISIGDNERPGGADYVAPRESGQNGEGFGAEYVGPEEDLSFGKPDLPDEAPPYEPHEQPLEAQPDMALPAEPDSMVVRTTAGGAETLIVRDPATGEWVNAETGNPFDLESHQRNFPQQMKEYEEYAKRNAELERTGQTAMQQGLDEIDQKYRQELDAIQKEMDQRHLEQLRRDQEWLEKEMEHAQSTSGWGRIMGDWVRNMGDDVAELGKAGKDAVVWTGETLGTAAGTLVYDPERIGAGIKDAYDSAKKSLASAVDEAGRTVRDIRNDPRILIETWAHTGRDAYQMGKTAVKTAVDIATDPRKQLELAKDMFGINDFGDSLDPNLPITGRVKKVLSGTFKLGTTLGTMGVGGGAKAATSVGRVTATGAKTATTAGRVAATGSKTLAVKGIKPSLAVKTGPNYAAVKRSADLRGVSKTAKTVVQNTADEMGLQIKARTIKSADAGRMIEAGQAVPKRVNMKAKTLSILDEILGGPKNSEGLVGYYKPKMPPKDVWNTLSPKTKAELADLYKTRHREFRKLADPMKELQALGEYKLEGGLVRDLKQGGKFVTSDLDIHDMVNFDGTPVSESVKKQAYNRMMNYGRGPGKPPVQSTVMHEGTMSWTKASDKVGYSEKAKQSLIDGASKEGPGKGITSFNPLAKPTAEKYVR